MNQITMSAYWPLLKWNSARSTGASTLTTWRSMKLTVVSPSRSAISMNSAPRVKTGSNFGVAAVDTEFASRGLKLDMRSQYHFCRRAPPAVSLTELGTPAPRQPPPEKLRKNAPASGRWQAEARPTIAGTQVAVVGHALACRASDFFSPC